jgi:hypothetical protein
MREENGITPASADELAAAIVECLDENEETDVVEAAQSLAVRRGDTAVLDRIDDLIKDAPVHDDVGALTGWPAAARYGYAHLLRCDELAAILPNLSPQRVARRRDTLNARLSRRLTVACAARRPRAARGREGLN